METVTQIIAGAQAVLDIDFDVQGCFEEYLSKEYKTFLQILRVIESVIPPLVRPYAGSRSMYLGKDVLGSVRSMTADTGMVEERYEYDAFGMPYLGDLSGWMNLGYTGKPYDTATGLYNYGFRDYRPAAARFTTEDPIRDGSNWFAYVNNDPVNWVDPWGLWDEALGKVVENHLNEKYEKGKNDCDIWVEKVVKESGKSLPSTWSPAATTTVATHIKDMQNELQNKPSPGANIVFHGGNHAMLAYLNEDGSLDIAHTSSKPGYAEKEHHNIVKGFEDDWGRYGSMQYASLEKNTKNDTPVSSTNNQTSSNGGKNK